MFKIGVSVKKSGNAVEVLRKAAVELPKRLGELTEESASAMATMARDFAPKNTGAMSEGITHETKRTAAGWEAVVEAGGGLIFVEFGTGPQASLPSKTGLPKSPEDIPHTSKRRWFVPFTALSDQQIHDLEFKYHYPTYEADGMRFFIVRGQAPQPFMYPSAIYEWDNIKEYFPEQLRKTLHSLMN